MEVAPCDSKGREYSESDDMFVDTPEDLVGKDVHFVVKVVNCRGLPNKYTVRLNIKFAEPLHSSHTPQTLSAPGQSEKWLTSYQYLQLLIWNGED